MVDHRIPPTVQEAHAAGQLGADRLAEELSGVYGDYNVRFTGRWRNDSIVITGPVMDGDRQVGNTTRTFHRDRSGGWSVHHDYLALNRDDQGTGFSNAYYDELTAYYRRSGLTHIDIMASLDRGGYAWARRGFTWDPRYRASDVRNIRTRMESMVAYGNLSPGDNAKLNAMIRRMRSRTPPTPREISDMSGDATDPTPPPNRPPRANGLGVRIMQGTTWNGIFYLNR